MKKQKVVIVLPAYNAEKTLERTMYAIPPEYRENIILVDDKSNDETVRIAEKMRIKVLTHLQNLGYGGNQKTCYRSALCEGADIIVMLHPDYQYPPEFITPLVAMLNTGKYDCVLGSRILAGEALRGGMPLYKYVSNRFLTLFENILTGAKLSEYHTGLRAFKREVLLSIPFQRNSDDFVFDNQILLQILAKKFRIGEVSCPARYFPEASSINFRRSVRYGLGCLYWGLLYFLGKFNIYRHPLLFNE